jgi:hypothetical protein
MKTWPRIKLVDERGRTVTVFERVPKGTAGGTGEQLHIDEVIDMPVAPVPKRGLVSLLAPALESFLHNFLAAHTHWPDEAAIIEAAKDILKAQGLVLVTREELVDLGKSTGAASTWYIDYAAMVAHITEHDGLDLSDMSITTHFAGEPRGESVWAPLPKPEGKKARIHSRAALDRDGFALPRDGRRHLDALASRDLPPVADMQAALDYLVDQAPDTRDMLTLTIDQLRRLVAQRC